MKVIKYLFVLAVGVACCMLGKTVIAYYRVPGHVRQGKELISRITAYHEKNGKYPSQEWFAEIGDDRITSEGHVWVYFNPPKHTRNDKYILIATRVEYGGNYYAGYHGGTIAGTSFESITSE